MAQRKPLETEQSYILSSISYNGKIEVTLNGIKSTYKGSSASVVNGQLYIDDQMVVKNDPRRIPNNSFSLFSESSIRELKEHASKSGYDVSIDSRGNISYSKP